MCLCNEHRGLLFLLKTFQDVCIYVEITGIYLFLLQTKMNLYYKHKIDGVENAIISIDIRISH